MAVARDYAQRVHAGATWIDIADPMMQSTRDVGLQVARDAGWIDYDIGPNGAIIVDSLRSASDAGL